MLCYILTLLYLSGKLEKYFMSCKIEEFLHTDGQKVTFSNQNQIPKNCESAGILKVLFDQILCENLINVVKVGIFMNAFALVLSAGIHSENGNWNQENLRHSQINVLIL